MSFAVAAPTVSSSRTESGASVMMAAQVIRTIPSIAASLYLYRRFGVRLRWRQPRSAKLPLRNWGRLDCQMPIRSVHFGAHSAADAELHLNRGKPGAATMERSSAAGTLYPGIVDV